MPVGLLCAQRTGHRQQIGGPARAQVLCGKGTMDCGGIGELWLSPSRQMRSSSWIIASKSAVAAV
jgi:hypothetical protein